MGPPRRACTSKAPTPGTRLDDGRADAEAPISILIEAQHLTGKGHAQSEQQQQHAYDPGELAREFIGSEKKDLRHVDQHNRDHEVRAPAMHRPQKPAQSDVVVKKLEAIPGFAGRRNVDQREQNAGDDLQAKQHRGCAAENIPPTRAAGGYGMLRCFDDGFG